ncbi:MAG TPA: cysteine desulfurase family protein [Candidatus Paceibacterota bacterium]|nr:cysteine desulfurase family protein [Candidatus Paceibacterota bacterium]
MASLYLDYAAATPLDPEVARVMRQWEDACFANAFSIHSAGREAKRSLEDARFEIAGHLGVRSDECHFMSGATNAAATALHGVLGHLSEKGVAYADMHIVVSVLEHSSVRACIETFMRRGVRVSVVGATPKGIVDAVALKGALRDDTMVVASMLVNSELGTIMPIRQISGMIAERYAQGKHRHAFSGIERPLLLVDASQATPCLPVRPHELGADLVIMDAGKIYGPKRTGLLWVRTGTPFASLCGMHGAVPYEGTPDVASALGFAKALSLAQERRTGDAERWKGLKTRLVEDLRERFPEVRVHGDRDTSVSNILNISFPGIVGEFLVAELDTRGIAVSAKSACLSGGVEGSYVVQAVDPERANNSIRISFGRETTEDDVDVLISALSDIVRR